jgi:glycogen(starch) synthase
MKILYWVNTFLPDIGGIQTLSADLVPALVRLGHEFIILASHGLVAAPDRSEHQGIQVYRFNMHMPQLQNDLRAIIRTRRYIQEMIASFEPDLIHLHPLGSEILFYLQIRNVMPLPTLATVHNNYSRRNIVLSAESGFGKVLRRADWVTSVSHDSMAWLRREVPELEPKSSVVHNGVPSTQLDVQPLSWTPPVLLYVGRLAPQKRLDILLRAFARVLDRLPQTRLVLAGTGSEGGTLQALAVELQIEAEVEFLGRIPPESVRELLNTATIFVMSSIYEGLPMVALEAAQMARPVVATQVGGIPEAVRHGDTGLLVEPEDPVALAEALLSLLSDPEQAAAMGRAGQEQVSEQFTIETTAARYDQLYNRLNPAAGEV